MKKLLVSLPSTDVSNDPGGMPNAALPLPWVLALRFGWNQSRPTSTRVPTNAIEPGLLAPPNVSSA